MASETTSATRTGLTDGDRAECERVMRLAEGCMTPATIIAGSLRTTPVGLALYSGRRLVAVLHPDTSAQAIASAIAAHFGVSARLVSGARGIEVHVPTGGAGVTTATTATWAALEEVPSC